MVLSELLKFDLNLRPTVVGADIYLMWDYTEINYSVFVHGKEGTL